MTYEFTCTVCGTKREVSMPLADYDTFDRTCKEELKTLNTVIPLLLPCWGTLERSYTTTTPSLRFVGGGWTPKHHI